MFVGVNKSLTTGAVFVAAGVVALSPVTAVRPDAAPAARTVQFDLTAVTDPLQAAAILAGGLSESADLLAYYAVDAAAAALVGAYDLGQQDPRSFYATVRQIVSAPAIIASPTAEALAQILPPPVGGTDGDRWNNTAADGAVVDFIDHVLRPASDAINAQIAQALHVYPDTGTPLPDPTQVGPPANLFQGAVTLAFGLGGTAVRTLQAVAVSPLAVARLAVLGVGALATGNNKSLYLAVRDIVDAPLWAADPTIDALAKVLPGPLGGTDGKHEVSSAKDGQVIQFRDKVLWRATNAVRNGVAKALNVDPTYGDPLPALKTAPVDADPGIVANATPKENSEAAVSVSAPQASPTRATARVRVAGSGRVGAAVAGVPAPARTSATDTSAAAKSNKAAVRNQIKGSVGQLKVGVETLNDRLRASSKRATAAQAQKSSSTHKSSADSPD